MDFKRIDWALFTGLFVAIAILVLELLISNPPFLITVFVSGSAAFIGGLLGHRLFLLKGK